MFSSRLLRLVVAETAEFVPIKRIKPGGDENGVTRWPGGYTNGVDDGSLPSS
jgi:hypothetical protein